MNAEEWLEGYERRDGTTNGEDLAAAIIRALLAENARWKKAIEGLTPGGSEFVDDPENCAAYIRKRTEWPKMILDLKQENAELRARIDGLATDMLK